MKNILLAMSAVALLAASPSSAIAQNSTQIEYEMIFLNEIYQEIGRWTVYCDGRLVEEGEFSHRHQLNYYGCD